MRRFLVVGCGGAGGAVVGWLAEQLRSDLAARDGPHMPWGGQVVHVDVPARGADHGGRYVGIGANRYGVAAERARAPLADARRLDLLASWAPLTPEQVPFRTFEAAGQARAVGRILTLAGAAGLRDGLRAAWEDVHGPDAPTDLHRRTEPGLDAFDNEPPIVFVVASMAGGAGAGMVLDVCRLLAAEPGVDPAFIALFLITPNTFDALPPTAQAGMAPNALALFGEVVAAQTGSAAETDAATLDALGVRGGQRPFARLFPVGRLVGLPRARLGDGGPDAVYRGLGRGLAGLLASPTATARFIADLRDGGPGGDRDAFGWGCARDSLPWGSFGHASLAMGRDGYPEYAAQRLARAAIDRLLSGHLQPGHPGPSAQQIEERLSAEWAATCWRVGLPAAETEVADWLGAVYHWEEADAAAAAIVDVHLSGLVHMAETLPEVALQELHRTAITGEETAARAACVNAPVAWASRWHRELLARIERELREAVPRAGLPHAFELLGWLGSHLGGLAAHADLLAADWRETDVTALPEGLGPALASSAGPSGEALAQQLHDGYREQARAHVYAAVADLVGALARDAVEGVLRPLIGALGEAQESLAEDEAATRMWPSDGDPSPPAAYEPSPTEIVITRPAQFPAQFDADVRATLPEPDPYGEAVRRIIAGHWPTSGGERPPLGLLVRTTDWQSPVLPTEPPTAPMRAAYLLGVRAADLLDRARLYVARRGEPFDRFARTTLREHVRGGGPQEQAVVAAFDDVLRLARPLVAVHAGALQRLHPGAATRYRYAFSTVPLRGLGTAVRLRAALDGDPMIDTVSGRHLDAALGDGESASRIDVFGSYPPSSPLAFDAVLPHAAEEWAAQDDPARFWRWRRARPLPAALPMGDAERLAMVAGWLLGRIIGRIRLPRDPAARPAEILDDGEWLPFPHPLLTPVGPHAAEAVWLPAVLESVLVAQARATQPPVLGSLRPYQALRRLYDPSPQQPGAPAAEDPLTTWLAAGSAAESVVAGAASTGDRAARAAAWLAEVRALADDDGLPMLRDLAHDLRRAAEELTGHIRRATVRPGGSGTLRPERTGVFISYRRSDQPALAGRLFDRLADRFGEPQIFMDVEAIAPGLDFTEEVDRRLAHSRVLLVVIGKDWLAAVDGRGNRRLDQPRDYVRREIEAGLRDRDILVVPILVDETRMPGEHELPESLGPLVYRHARELRNQRFRVDCRDLIETLEEILGG